ncbi:dihydrofolate reductase family protein [Niabella yanshanensis]|uniref:Dihydrofolate reductase family protein n=1 Tax=Niabella yanshanensis TaxID=577386 RepID=A0ABZ0W1D1_9BACT|nr:dihydrofolate reductase family protein [Niabella yanshanensis]WQD37070.1 dihydrofolate reductase family protein [Niabella yanshanensis]
MRKIIVLSMITLDGVIQAPGGPKEDESDGFKYGGWTEPYGDEVYGKVVQEELRPASYLLGRKTFEIWERYWPNHRDYWPGINEGEKYVLSATRKDSDWYNTHFLTTLADIQQLKQSKGPDVQVWGSSELVHLLLSNDLVDELRLKIHPILLGKGKRLFDTNALPAVYKLSDTVITSTGVIIARYLRSGEVKTGQVEA